MPKPPKTAKEKDDFDKARKDLWKEVDRMYKRADVLSFLDTQCELVDIDTEAFTIRTLDYKGRNRRPLQVALRKLIRDNMSTKVKDDKTSEDFDTIEEKVIVIEEALLSIPVPLDEKIRKRNTKKAKNPRKPVKKPK